MSSRSSSPEIEGAVGGEVIGGDCNPTSKTTTMSTEDMDAGMQAFFENSRTNLMYELHQIQHGEKPVTGQANRERINQFLSKRFEVQAQNEGKENAPANVDDVEEHRPEAIVVEVEGLYQQQPVSSLLRSNVFRQHLNNIIRRNMSSFSITPRNSVSPRSSHQASPVPSQNSPSPDRQMQSRTDERARGSNSADGSHTQARHSHPASEDVTPTSTPESRNTSPPQSRSRTPPTSNSGEMYNLSTEVAANPEVNVVPPAPDLARMVHVESEEALQVQRENLVEEISELLHQRLVSSSLEGEFRGTMEVHLEQRLGQSGADGNRVRNFLRSLPVNPFHQRNDFSHLGIQMDNDLSDIDNISVTNISAAAVPYTQTNLHLSRELNALKAQMEEMKTMLKLSMEMQMDVQRAIRQEVAAAVSQASGDHAESSQMLNRARPVSDSHCLICLDSHADSVLYQCGHMCVCYGCGKHLMRQSAKCPVCRAPIRDIIRAYKCNVE